MRAYIIYGFGEGEWHGRNFVKALRVSGVDLTDKITEADYIIAHSGGCFDIPALRSDQLLMLIDPPYWPGRSLGERGRVMFMQMVKAMRPGNQPFYRFYENFRHFINLFTKIRSNVRIAERAKTFSLEHEAKHTNTILVRNTDDPWITPDLEKLQELNPHLSLVELPGTHLHCWEYPKDYIALLEQYKVI